MKKRLFLLCFIVVAVNCNYVLSQPSWPVITKENKPWTRWWWEGSIVNKKDLTAAMKKYSSAGLGGLELTVIYGVKGYEDQFINYLSPKWMKMFTYTLKKGQKLNLGIDLTNASGWPFGGPWVDPSDACKNINYKTYNLKTGETLNKPVTFIQKPIMRAVGVKPEYSELADPVGKSKNLQLYALDQIRFEKEIPLHCLMAYSDAGDIIDLTGKVDKDGKLNWTAPDGNWILYALFQGWHGKMVERAGPGGEGDVIDHFSGEALTRYLSYFDKAFKGYNIQSLRGYFNDSYEVDDAIGQSNWTPNFFEEFKTRRGYDLRNNLPALFGKDSAQKNSGVLCDYRETISELLLENFTKKWAGWAHKQGKIIRNQAHGSPANILDLYAATDIPETEGHEVLELKFASSAANVTGKKLISSESATWLNEHFLSSLSDVKLSIDKYFLGGVNHIFYHGTCFSPQNEPWPGWLFYAAVEFTPANSFWNDFPALNNYIAHVQSFLQNSKPDNDILLYFPIFDPFSKTGSNMLVHFNGLRNIDKMPFTQTARRMLDKGYAFDFISDKQLTDVKNADKSLQTGGVNYQTIVIPDCNYIPLETFQKILDLAQNGATVIFINKLPGNVAGWFNLDIRRQTFDKIKNNLVFDNTNISGQKMAVFGKGLVLLGDSIDELLSFAKVRRESMVDKGLQYTRRKNDNVTIYFIANHSERAIDEWITLQVNCKSAAIYNPMNVKLGMAKFQFNEGKTQVYVQLAPGESNIIETYDSEVKGQRYSYYKIAGVPSKIEGTWTVKFIEGGTELPQNFEISALKSWTDFGGEAVRNFSGTAEYTINFAKPSLTSDLFLLDLGRVCESARVSLNGKEICTLIGPTYQIYLENTLLKEQNTLVVKVSNLMANRIADLDRRGIEWKKFYNANIAARKEENKNAKGLFDASKWKPRESGLIGPVTIAPVRSLK
jgi:hypothetical protein